jgi:vacuolar-type H+-ATPase subunit B/Vma2
MSGRDSGNSSENFADVMKELDIKPKNYEYRPTKAERNEVFKRAQVFANTAITGEIFKLYFRGRTHYSAFPKRRNRFRKFCLCLFRL